MEGELALCENYGHTPTSDVPTSDAHNHTNESEVTDLLAVIYEIFHAMLAVDCNRSGVSFGSKNALKCSLYIRSKIKATHDELMIFSVKATCNRLVLFMDYLRGQGMPALQQLICKMQTLEKESHLAIQEVDESNNKKTSALWLDPRTPDCVTILSEKEELVKATDDMKSIIQMRVLMHKSSITLCSIEICDLLERIKFINPQVELSFMMNQGISFELTLCNITSIRCNSFEVYTGKEVLLRRRSSNYRHGEVYVKCSQKFKFVSSAVQSEDPSLSVTCIAYFVPLHEIEQKNDKRMFSTNFIPGKIQIHIYNPSRFPCNMKIVNENLDLLPHTLVEWQHFGFQVKKHFKSSTYTTECSARMFHTEMLPKWTEECDQFNLTLAFVITGDDVLSNEISISNNDIPQNEQMKVLYGLSKGTYSIFQESAKSSLDELFGKSIESQEVCPKNSDDDIFVKMIPEITNSLVDIFTRSTNTDFRSEVNNLVPTSSRITMCKHIEKKLWNLIKKPVTCNSPELPTHSDVPASKPSTPSTESQNPNDESELPIDDWEFSDDSLDVEEIEALSPDSLDLNFEIGEEDISELGHLNNQAHIFHDPTAILNNSNTTSSTRIPLNNMNQDGKIITMAPTTDHRQYTETPVFENVKSTTQSLPSMPRKRSSEFSMNVEDSGNPPDLDTLHVQTTPCEDFKKKKFSESNLAKSLDLHCKEQSCHLELTLDTSAVQPIPHCCKHVDESDWFDEDEVAQWFAEMED